MLITSPRVAGGLLSASAWEALRAGPVLVPPVLAVTAVEALVAAGVDVRHVGTPATPADIADQLIDAAGATGTATWWAGGDGNEQVAAAIAERSERETDGVVDVATVRGSWDLPGAKLLDVVATMDRLRSPGGCPWDAAQDHRSLAPYLLEEAYEAFQTIEDDELIALRDELGDVLLQVVFHARLAAERVDDQRWTIDDVATGLVDKLVRRHPHVFGDVHARDAAEVNANWERIKADERAGESPLLAVPMAAPALTLAATLQRKATRAGIDAGADRPLGAMTVEFADDPSEITAGRLLWAAVAAMCSAGVDAESALRAYARTFRDQALTAE
jgi:XTP/dITP diphosphohydrolase